MIASNSFLRFFASVAFCGVEVLAAAGVVVVVAVVVAGVDASGVFVVVAAAAAAEPKAVVGVPNGADGFPNGAATDLLPLPNAGVEVVAAPKPVDGFEPKVPPVVGVEVEVGDVPPVGLVANELKTEPKAGFAAKGAAEPNGDVFEAAAALPNGDAVVIGSVVFVVVGAAAAGAAGGGGGAAGGGGGARGNAAQGGMPEVVLRVAMSCGGCSGAVERILSKTEGVDSFDIDLEAKKVTVRGSLEPSAVVEAVAKAGKATEIWS